MTMVEEYMRDAMINSIIHDEAFMYFLMLLVAVLIFTVYITKSVCRAWMKNKEQL